MGYFINYKYELAVASYIENAYEVNTPDRMVEQVQKAINGMRELGLKEDMHGAMFFPKPDNSMDWQYDFLNSVVERAKSVQEWRASMEKSGQVETLGDVYEQKMDNLRDFIKEGGRADWIAKNTYLVNEHPIYYFLTIIIR